MSRNRCTGKGEIVGYNSYQMYGEIRLDSGEFVGFHSTELHLKSIKKSDSIIGTKVKLSYISDSKISFLRATMVANID